MFDEVMAAVLFAAAGAILIASFSKLFRKE